MLLPSSLFSVSRMAGRHGELGPVGPMETLARHEAVKVVATLSIPGGTKGQGANGAGHHGIVVLLMGLGILAKFDAAVFLILNVKPGDYGMGAECLGHTKLVREGVDLEDAKKDHFDNHPRGVVFDGGGVIGVTSLFFDGTNAPFDVGDVFVFAADVEFRLEVSSNDATSAFKFTVTEDVGDAEAAFLINAVNALERFNEGAECAVVEDFGSNETDVLEDREEKGMGLTNMMSMQRVMSR
jgi:hypothetical protein